MTLFFFKDHETDIPPTPQKARPQDWFPRSHGHEGWSQGHQCSSPQGPQAADGRLITEGFAA
jgi:hypothetical protein